jgi:hypothetical protein
VAVDGDERPTDAGPPGAELAPTGQGQTGRAQSADCLQPVGDHLDGAHGGERDALVTHEPRDLLAVVKETVRVASSTRVVVIVDIVFKSGNDVKHDQSSRLSGAAPAPRRRRPAPGPMRIVQAFLGDRALTTSDLRTESLTFRAPRCTARWQRSLKAAS